MLEYSFISQTEYECWVGVFCPDVCKIVNFSIWLSARLDNRIILKCLINIIMEIHSIDSQSHSTRTVWLISH